MNPFSANAFRIPKLLHSLSSISPMCDIDGVYLDPAHGLVVKDRECGIPASPIRASLAGLSAYELDLIVQKESFSLLGQSFRISDIVYGHGFGPGCDSNVLKLVESSLREYASWSDNSISAFLQAYSFSSGVSYDVIADLVFSFLSDRRYTCLLSNKHLVIYIKTGTELFGLISLRPAERPCKLFLSRSVVDVCPSSFLSCQSHPFGVATEYASSVTGWHPITTSQLQSDPRFFKDTLLAAVSALCIAD